MLITTETVQAGHGDESSDNDNSIVYDGTNEEALPEHVRVFLNVVSDEEAEAWQKNLVGDTIAEILVKFPAPLPLAEPPSPDTLWSAAKDEVQRIAEMFKMLHDAGMPAEMAMTIIQQRLPSATSLFQHGIQTAGTRVEGVTTPFGVQLGSRYGATIVPPFGNGA